MINLAIKIALAVLALAVHELGHCLGVWAADLKVRGLVISWCGVGVRRQAGTPLQNAIVALWGPVVSAAFAVMFHGSLFGAMNLLMCLINLVPFPNSDGMRVIKSLIEAMR